MNHIIKPHFRQSFFPMQSDHVARSYDAKLTKISEKISKSIPLPTFIHQCWAQKGHTKMLYMTKIIYEAEKSKQKMEKMAKSICLNVK